METIYCRLTIERIICEWLAIHVDNENECWIELKCVRPFDDNRFYYLDAVGEALCFGWVAGKRMQRFTPRTKNSPWTELNKERVRRLEILGQRCPSSGSEDFQNRP